MRSFSEEILSAPHRLFSFVVVKTKISASSLLYPFPFICAYEREERSRRKKLINRLRDGTDGTKEGDLLTALSLSLSLSLSHGISFVIFFSLAQTACRPSRRNMGSHSIASQRRRRPSDVWEREREGSWYDKRSRLSLSLLNARMIWTKCEIKPWNYPGKFFVSGRLIVWVVLNRCCSPWHQDWLHVTLLVRLEFALLLGDVLDLNASLLTANLNRENRHRHEGIVKISWLLVNLRIRLNKATIQDSFVDIHDHDDQKNCCTKR